MLFLLTQDFFSTTEFWDGMVSLLLAVLLLPLFCDGEACSAPDDFCDVLV